MKQIRISKQVINDKQRNKYRTIAYIFIKLKQGLIYGDVTFTIDEYLSIFNISKDERSDSRKLALIAIQETIDKYVDKEINSSIFNKEIYYDVLNATSKKQIHFFINDVTMNCKNGNFIVVDGDNITRIIDYSRELLKSKIANRSYSTDLINIYCYLLSRMSYRKLKNEDGTAHYSNNPIYFYSYKNNILEDMGMNLVYFNKLFEILSYELHLVREVKFKKHVIGEKGREKYFMNFPNFYFIEDDGLEENLRNAIKKYCSEKGIDKKTFVPSFK